MRIGDEMDELDELTKLNLKVAQLRGWKIFYEPHSASLIAPYFDFTDIPGRIDWHKRNDRVEVENDAQLKEIFEKHNIGWSYLADWWQWIGWVRDMGSAWGLVEEMNATNYPIPQIYRTDDDELWHVSIRTSGDMGFEDYSGKTAPEAICRAYVAWKEAH
jgi:hypothetical protein